MIVEDLNLLKWEAIDSVKRHKVFGKFILCKYYVNDQQFSSHVYDANAYAEYFFYKNLSEKWTIIYCCDKYDTGNKACSPTVHIYYPCTYTSVSSLSFLSVLLFLFYLLIFCGAALPFPSVVHARSADRAGDEVGRAGRHEVGHCRGDVHPLVCHQVICQKRAQFFMWQDSWECY